MKQATDYRLDVSWDNLDTIVTHFIDQTISYFVMIFGIDLPCTFQLNIH